MDRDVTHEATLAVATSASPIDLMLAVEEIKQLKYRYLRTLDLKRWEEFAALFVPEATGDYAGLTFGSRDELVGFMRDSLGPQMITLHHCHHPEISVYDDRATGVWYLEDRVLMPEHRVVLEGAAFYEDRYVRRGGRWLIEHTGYRRTYEATLSMDDLPSYHLRIGTAYESAGVPDPVGISGNGSAAEAGGAPT